MPGGELLYRRRENILDRGIPGGNRTSSLLDLLAARFKLPVQFNKSFDQRPRQFIQQLALWSEVKLGPAAFKETRAQLAFESLNLQRYGRLSKPQAVRGPRDTPSLDDGAEPS